MPNKTVGLRMASATKSDIADMFKLRHIIEAMKHELPTSVKDFDHLDFDQKEKNFLSQIFDEYGEIEIESFINYIDGLMHGFHRVVMGYEVLYINCANPDLDYLDFNKDISESTDLWNKIEEDLKQGKTVQISPESELGKMILKDSGKEDPNA